MEEFPMRTGIIGLGNLGTAIGNLISTNGHAVLGWEYNAQVAEEINQHHTNTRYLAGIELDSKLVATTNLDEIFQECSIIFIALPSIFILSTLGQYTGQIDPKIIIVNMAKGIDRQSGLTAFQTVGQIFPDNPKIMLSGPAIANEFSKGMPTVVVLAGKEFHDLMQVSRIMDNDHWRTRFSDDEMGVELGGILKNIYASGLGLFDGEGITSINFRAVYLTLALEEMSRFGECMGARQETFMYLAGMGDLMATALSEHSHNRHMGELLAKGLTLEQIQEEMGVVPEGYNTLRTVLYFAEKMHLTLPIAKGIWDVMHGRSTAHKFIYSFIRDFVDRGPR
jgi:glycerol-3-phosphate dehydrogenase (NAD(P)+)